MIRVRNLHKSFGNQHVLRGINLDIEPKSITCVMGSSGTGKSVFIKLLIGLLEADQGEIIIDGESIVGISEKQMNRIRMKMGMLFQDAALFDDMDVMENVAFPLTEHTDMFEDEIQDRVIKKLKEVGLENIEHKLPSELSGGMRKRVGLARALMLDPKIIFFDEPTTGLDPIMTSQIGDLILQTHQRYDVTFIIINHDVNLSYKVANKIVMFDEGRVAEDTTPQGLIHTKHPFVRKFFAAHFDMEKHR
ncbi:MAG: ABC transporter ATP-binding protein [Bdellovibrionales bacterium]|nr:ABC transporter ATP-binding protein [Bdellovibrionales bacterium]